MIEEQREQWEWDLTEAIEPARQAQLTKVVLAIQNAIGEIRKLKDSDRDLRQLKQILSKRR